MPRKRKGFELNGIVLLDKPTGISSNQALQRVKHLFHAAKAGHTGNLDPMATGMLPICFGRATKLSEYMLESDKTYIATVKLGEKTDTGDADGIIIETAPVPDFTEAELLTVLESFKGKIKQIPPMYSALKHNGKCLYELARQGIEIERKAREVTIYDICHLDEDCHPENCHPRVKGKNHVKTLTLKITCSKGTYIRTLAEDIAKKLGTLAHLTALRRTYCAGFDEPQMKTLEELKGEQSEILSLTCALKEYPEIQITSEQVTTLLQGKEIDITALTSDSCHSQSSLDPRLREDDTIDHNDIRKTKLMHGSQLFAIAEIQNDEIVSRKIVA